MVDQFGISVVKSPENIAYIFDDDAIFYGTGFKVFSSQEIDCLLPCVKSRWNGKTKLHYFTKGCIPLTDFLLSTSVDQFKNAMLGVVQGLLSVEENGFLSMKNIVLATESIYVDLEKGSPKMIYLPVTCSVSGRNVTEVASRMCSLLQECLLTVDNDAMGCSDLQRFLEQDRASSFYDLLSVLNDVGGGQSAGCRVDKPSGSFVRKNCPPSISTGKRGDEKEIGCFVLTAKKNAQLSKIRILDKETILGRSKSKADFVVSSNTAVSRAHCKLLFDSGRLFVLDLGGRNGTFVNRDRLKPNDKVELKEGFELRMADVSYLIGKEGR